MSDLILVYVTCGSPNEAHDIGNHLLNKKLAACVNVFSGMESMSLWPPLTGKIETAVESVLIIKTVKSKWTGLVSEIKKIHSYDTPAIIALPVQDVDKKYYDWIRKELSDKIGG